MQNRMFQYLSEQDMERIKAKVSSFFPVYRSGVEYDSLVFFCEVDESRLEDDFNRLRVELRDDGYIPVIREKGGEFIIYVKKSPSRKFRGIWLNLVMLFLTLGTTAFAGMAQWASYTGTSELLTLNNFIYGEIFFTVPLLTILGVHEMGHYFMAKRHNVRASLPFFIPFMLPLGTMGAFISIREPIPDRKSLLDIGVAGPIAGFLVTIPVSIIGIWLGNTYPSSANTLESGAYVVLQMPIMYQIMAYFMPIGHSVMHPTAFAGWVGFIVTAINLLPAGQLDGGHIIRGLLGEKAKYASYGALGFLFVMGIFYPGWLIFGILILFLGIRHMPPLNDITKLTTSRKIVGVIAVIMLIVSFAPVPMQYEEASRGMDIQHFNGEQSNISAFPGTHIYYNFSVSNTGEMIENPILSVKRPQNWSALLFVYNTSNSRDISEPLPLRLSPGEVKNYTLDLEVPEYPTPGNHTIEIALSYDRTVKSINFTAICPSVRNVTISAASTSADIEAGGSAVFNISVENSGFYTENITLSAMNIPYKWSACLFVNDSHNATSSLVLRLLPSEKMNVSLMVCAPPSAGAGEYMIEVVPLQYPDEKIDFTLRITAS